MNKSESIAKLINALSKAQGLLKNPHFDSVNPHFKSKFASLAAVRESVIPVFSECGLSVSQWPVSNGTSAGCVTHLGHISGEWMEETFLIPVDKGNAHGYASAVTYAKRISMQSIAAVVGDEDDDANAAIDKPAAPNTPTQILKEAHAALSDEGRAWVDTIAADAIVMLARGDVEGAYLHIEAQKMDAEHKSALWSLLDSKQRAALKKHSQTAKEAA